MGPGEDRAGGESAGEIILRWRELRATELVLEEIAEEFGGEDPAKRPFRVTLEQTKAKLQAVHAGYSEFIRPFDLPEPEEDDLEKVREVVQRAADS